MNNNKAKSNETNLICIDCKFHKLGYCAMFYRETNVHMLSLQCLMKIKLYDSCNICRDHYLKEMGMCDVCTNGNKVTPVK